ncbi:hypothetical protein BDZ94DRAFT_1198454 [Collybia nuda]|uniref:CN hydrolase domain-containing protein n=1 Tax=Collybia nuda TaxID=64659 RepID=A0A9P5XYU3_9AGAR|nr:hypothetical protein BDZ94DRAFT_1198454 [Collybia nuda]
MNLRTLIFQDYPNVIFISTSTLAAFLALRPTPSPAPIVLTLTALLVYSRILFPSQHAASYTTILWFTISVAGTLAKVTASLDALSSAAFSIIALFTLSAITSFFILSIIYLDTKVCARSSSPWVQISLFPALWTSLWFGVSYLSPVGRLLALSPVEGIDSYDWILQLVGAPGVDWIVAAWAVVCSQAIGAWFIGLEEKESEGPLIAHEAPARQRSHQLSRAGSIALLTTLVLAPAAFSTLRSNYPQAVISADTTPLSVGCILPPLQRSKRQSLTLDDYIDESVKWQNSAKILLWPEGAVTFNSEAEREEGFAKVKQLVNQTAYIGVSFEEVYNDKEKGSRRSISKHNGLAIISRWSSEPHLVYYKRHLVPIAESFSLTHSTQPPSIFTLELPRPKGMNKTDWAPGPNHTRPIPITASICLDFADPSPFAELSSKPALVLGPARTWDIAVGYAMWRQAKQRAEEVGTMILWCDGGDGGVSGIAGGGFSDFTQVGPGSWVRAIGVQYPFNTQRTPFAYLGSATILLFWVVVLGGYFSEVLGYVPQVIMAKRGYRDVRNLFRSRPREDEVAVEGDLLG